jgi:hypothetical protein
MDNHTKDSKKSPITSFDYLSLEFLKTCTSRTPWLSLKLEKKKKKKKKN